MHIKTIPAKEPHTPGGIRHSVSLYLYPSPDALLALGGLDYQSDDFENFRILMDMQQFWGFADAEGQHIHIWVGKGVSRDHIVHLLAHELSHVFLDGDAMDDEARADTVGWIARQSWAWAQQIKKGQADGNL